MYAPVISQRFTRIWTEFGILLRLAGIVNMIFNFKNPISIKG